MLARKHKNGLYLWRERAAKVSERFAIDGPGSEDVRTVCDEMITIQRVGVGGGVSSR